LGLILFLWVHNPLGLCFPSVYNINHLGLLLTWFIISIMVKHNQLWSTVVNHGTLSHYETNCFHLGFIYLGFLILPIEFNIIPLGSWSLGVLILISWVYNIDRLGLWFRSQPWFIMKSTMVNHGPTLKCDKDCLNIKINDGQSCLF